MLMTHSNHGYLKAILLLDPGFMFSGTHQLEANLLQHLMKFTVGIWNPLVALTVF